MQLTAQELLHGHVSLWLKQHKSHCFALHMTCLLLMAPGAEYQMTMLYPSVDLFDALLDSQQKDTPHGKTSAGSRLNSTCKAMKA